MPTPLFSPLWYRVADLRPRLRSHARVHRHRYRGQTWYVLQDNSNARHHRFTPAAYYIIGLMDGQRSVGEIWDAANVELGDDAPTQDEIIRVQCNPLLRNLDHIVEVPLVTEVLGQIVEYPAVVGPALEHLTVRVDRITHITVDPVAPGFETHTILVSQTTSQRPA